MHVNTSVVNPSSFGAHIGQSLDVSLSRFSLISLIVSLISVISLAYFSLICLMLVIPGSFLRDCLCLQGAGVKGAGYTMVRHFPLLLSEAFRELRELS